MKKLVILSSQEKLAENIYSGFEAYKVLRLAWQFKLKIKESERKKTQLIIFYII